MINDEIFVGLFSKLIVASAANSYIMFEKGTSYVINNIEVAISNNSMRPTAWRRGPSVQQAEYSNMKLSFKLDEQDFILVREGSDQGNITYWEGNIPTEEQLVLMKLLFV